MKQAEPMVTQLERKRLERQADGEELPVAITRAAWRKVRGPIAAAALTAERIGWKFVGPFRVKDHTGAEVLLTDTPPALIKRMAVDALALMTEKKIAARIARDEPQYQGRTACIDLVRTTVAHARDLSQYQRGIMRAVTCGAVMTGSRAIRLGYAVSGLCPLCNSALDTLAHRVYECPCTAAAVQAAVPKWFWREAGRKASGCTFWTTGVCPNPADLAPLPDTALNVIVEKVGPAAHEGESGGLMAIRGRAYFDGSCTTPVIRRMARAACAIAQTDEEGSPLKILQAAVPRHLPQSAQAAEFLGYAITVRAVEGPTAVVGDCMNVVRAANGVGRNVLAPNRVYAGLVLSTYAQPDKKKMAGVVAWTKAHRTLSGSETPQELRDFRGNEAADSAAKAALDYHPRIGADANDELAYYEKKGIACRQSGDNGHGVFPSSTWRHGTASAADHGGASSAEATALLGAPRGGMAMHPLSGVDARRPPDRGQKVSAVQGHVLGGRSGGHDEEGTQAISRSGGASDRFLCRLRCVGPQEDPSPCEPLRPTSGVRAAGFEPHQKGATPFAEARASGRPHST